MLKLEQISYAIGNKQILHSISAVLQPGEVTMILGPNGSGKSSLLRIFSGAVDDYTGEVWYDERNLRAIKKLHLAHIRAVMSQQPELSFPLPVEEVVMMGRYPHFEFNPSAHDHQLCDAAIERLKLTDFRKRNYLTLSGGERQRVQFARVLAQLGEESKEGHRFLFLDEPLNNLDIRYQHAFLKEAAAFAAQPATVVAVIHDLNLALQYADRLLFLKEGELVAYGKPEEIVTEELVQEVFAVQSHILQNPLNGKPIVVYK